MSVYRAQMNDTPASIAAKFGHPNQVAQLIAANPHKATMMDQGVQTWRSLRTTELLALPAAWRVKGLGTLGDPNSDGTASALASIDPTTLCQAGNPIVTAFQTSWNAANPSATQLTVDGKYGPMTRTALLGTLGSGSAVPAACTSYGASSATYTAADVVSFANAINGDATICNGTPNANVSNFQSAYNQIYGGTLTVDGKYGPATFGAMNGLISSGAISTAAAACSIYGGASGSGSGGGVVVVPPSPPPGTTTINNTQTPGTSNTGMIIAGIAAVALGVGAFMYLRKHPQHGAAAGPMSSRPTRPMRRLAAHRR